MFDVDEEKPINIMEDGVFKAMLTQKTDDSREALRSLISACLHRKVAKVRVENNELATLFLKAKSVRLDVNVTFDGGEAANIEMQMCKTDDNLKRRAEYNVCMLAANQKAKGLKYLNVKRVYQIFFFNFVIFPGSDKLPRRYYFKEEKENDRLSDLTEVIFYELPKLERRFRDFQEGKIELKSLTNEEKWCIYMKYRHENPAGDIIKRLCRSEEGIMKAEKAVDRMSWSQSWAFFKMSRDKARRDYDSAIICAKEKGHAEGEGKKAFEIAKKMKDAGEPLGKIISFTCLSVEEIENL
jgi:predicted transposase/invertase (TIGR01784 family)